MTKKKQNSLIATIVGLLTSVATAIVVIDFNTFSFQNPNDLMKLFVIAMPAIGGYISQLKEK
jgi:hypothetical protein